MAATLSFLAEDIRESHGVRRVGGTEPVDARTLFRVGSLTKGVTAAAVGVLVDGGMVDWDDPVRLHGTGFALADPWVTERFTIRDALAMRDGIPGGDSIALFTKRTRQEILARAGSLHPSRFRATYGDSPNLDYFLAGEVVTAAAGESWDEFVEERIFRPLGMNATSTVVSEYRGVTLIEDGGALPGFGAVIAMIPERNVGVALLSNASLNQSIGMLNQLKFELLDLFIPRLGSP